MILEVSKRDWSSSRADRPSAPGCHFSLRAIAKMVLLDFDTIELDISLSCANLFVRICISNVSATLGPPAVL
jgi:hypothetical protein